MQRRASCCPCPPKGHNQSTNLCTVPVKDHRLEQLTLTSCFSQMKNKKVESMGVSGLPADPSERIRNESLETDKRGDSGFAEAPRVSYFLSWGGF